MTRHEKSASLKRLFGLPLPSSPWSNRKRLQSNGQPCPDEPAKALTRRKGDPIQDAPVSLELAQPLFEDAPTGLDTLLNAIVQVDTNQIMGYWAITPDMEAYFGWQHNCPRCSRLGWYALTTEGDCRFSVAVTQREDDNYDSLLRFSKKKVSEECPEQWRIQRSPKECFTKRPERYMTFKFYQRCTVCWNVWAVQLGQIRPFTMAVADFTYSGNLSNCGSAYQHTSWALPLPIQYALFKSRIKLETRPGDPLNSSPSGIALAGGQLHFVPQITEEDRLTLDDISVFERPGFSVLENIEQWCATRTDLYCRNTREILGKNVLSRC
ncbi:hypothetical protein LTR70_004880 [Exophiala xenobiotica]|uniref:Uncharacterized protein n=1 Tax=Lithohypha guttulata TaxID=1690604 RepID=A0ABR0KBW3_9EURO|nr:hypothetical protein LTR24_004498 [Lithohypha guttulata]KAK5319835.1 hypothetical protein LTR70_004880 [Exophiala xenobiotica]